MILYHKDDHDGHASGWVMHNRFPTLELLGVTYGDKIPDGVHTFVDFCPDEAWLGRNEGSVIIDHHKSNANKLEKWSQHTRVYDCGLSGVELTWEYCYPGEEMPWWLELIGRWDRWDHDSDVINMHYYYEQFDTHPEMFNWGEEPPPYWMTLGEAVRKAADEQNRRMRERVVIKDLWGWKVGVLYGRADSRVFDYQGYEIGVMVTEGGVSLRSETVDVSVIAQKYGGGGHKGAAGFGVVRL